MRFLFVSSAIACIGLAVCSAAAGAANAKRYPNAYSSCYCYFGYPNLACMPVVSCYDEGGRCRKSCPRQP
jgi:hypothetical protein